MHSIAIPSSPAFLTIPSFITRPTPCCPSLPLTMLQSPLKKTRYPDAEISEVSSQLFAVQILSKVSTWPRPLTPGTAAFRTLNVPNVSYLAETSPWRPCVTCGRPPSPPASPVNFFEQMPSAFHSVPGVFYPGSCLRSSDVLGAALQPRLEFSIVDTFA